MTRKVIVHNKNHNVINIKLHNTKKKKRSKNKKHHHIIQQAHLPPFSSIIPNPVSSQINRPYYVETGSIHPLMQEPKAKSVDLIKDLIQPPTEPQTPLALPPPQTPPALPAPEDEELRNNLHTEFKKLKSHFTDQYHDQYNDPPIFEDQEKETRHEGIKNRIKIKGPKRPDGIRDAPNPAGLTTGEYNNELKNLQKRIKYHMDPKTKEKRENKLMSNEDTRDQERKKEAAKIKRKAEKGNKINSNNIQKLIDQVENIKLRYTSSA